MERCEGRVLRTTYTVTALSDSGQGSGTRGDLRYCLAQANGDGQRDTVDFAVAGTIQLGSPLPSLTSGRGITVAGPGAAALTIRGGGASAAFTMLRVKQGAVVTIAGLTMVDGNALQSGGAIFNGGHLTLNNMTFADNTAPRNGGALNNIGSMTINDSVLIGNSVRATNGGVSGASILGNGGAIENSGFLAINRSVLSGNLAGTAGGAIDSVFATAQITDSLVTGNSAERFGGGISLNGPNDFAGRGGTLTLLRTTVSNNHAGVTSDTGYAGGVGGNDSSVSVVDSTFSGNTSGRRAGGLGENGGQVLLDQATFTGNQTNGSGGALSINGGVSITGRGKTAGSTLTIQGSTFTNNLAGRNGGGIESTSTTAKVSSSTLAGNAASAFGGAISLDFDPNFRLTHGSLIISGSTLRDNTAGQGGAISTFDQLTITGSTITGNLALGTGGGIYTGVTPTIQHSTIQTNQPNNTGKSADVVVATP